MKRTHDVKPRRGEINPNMSRDAAKAVARWCATGGWSESSAARIYCAGWRLIRCVVSKRAISAASAGVLADGDDRL